MSPTTRILFVWTVSVAAATAGVRLAHAFHTVFDYRVQRFEADGNVFGPAGGAPDLVDEFDNGTIAPQWSTILGTTVETGGELQLRQPGTHFNAGVGLDLDLSDVQSTAEVVESGSPFTVTSRWTRPTVGQNHLIHMTLFGHAGALGTPWEFFGVDISNFAGQGLLVTQHRALFTGVWPPAEVQNVAIQQADITGDVLFRTAVDTTAGTAVSSFSLDGGATWQSPFTPMTFFGVTSVARVLLGADPAADQGPTTTTTAPPTTTTTLPGGPLCAAGGGIGGGQLTVTAHRAVAGDESVAFRGHLVNLPFDPLAMNPALESTRFRLDMVSPVGAVSWAVEVPGYAAPNGCGPKDGWRKSKNKWLYRNVSGALPPSCIPGTAAGLRAMRLVPIDGQTLELKLRTKNTTLTPLPGDGAVMRLAAYVGPVASNCAAADLACATSPKRSRCR
jgi:hypothetical protein